MIKDRKYHTCPVQNKIDIVFMLHLSFSLNFLLVIYSLFQKL